MRLDGWKAIANYLKRDRSTVIRWANERGMPVHRVPGGERGTIFAIASELDQWLIGQRGSDDEPAHGTDEPGLGAPRDRTGALRPRRRGRMALVAVASGALCVGLAAFVSSLVPHRAKQPRFHDPQHLAMYLDARDRLQEDDPKSIDRAVGELRTLARAEPDIAAAWSALAYAYNVETRFGDMPARIAFPAAMAAARRAIALDRDDATAHRILGQALFWWAQDGPRAGVEMRRAIDLAPDEASAHHAYGNMLWETGAYADGLMELRKAQALHPGFCPLRVDLVRAEWSEGNIPESARDLTALTKACGRSAPFHQVAIELAIDRKDWPEFASEVRKMAAITGDTDLQREGDALTAAISAPGDVAARVAAVERPISIRPNPPQPAAGAFIMSQLGRRTDLIRILDGAVARGERWAYHGYRTRIAARWRGDAAVQKRLARLAMLPVK